LRHGINGIVLMSLHPSTARLEDLALRCESADRYGRAAKVWAVLARLNPGQREWYESNAAMCRKASKGS